MVHAKNFIMGTGIQQDGILLPSLQLHGRSGGMTPSSGR